MMKRFCALLTALVMVLCAVSALAETAGADPVLVTVDGEEVRESTELVQAWKNYLLMQVGSDPDAETLQMVNQYAMEYAIEFIVARQNLEKLGKGYTQEDLDAERASAKAYWDSVVENIAAEQFGVGADATDEEKAAGKADAINFILENYGYTEDTYMSEIELNMIYTRTEEYAAADMAVTDEEIEAYFNQLVEADRMTLLEYSGVSTDSGLSEEEINKAMVSVYEMFTNYGYSFLYTPEGYRGINHILLKVDEELMNAWTDLQAKLEEQADSNAEGTDGTETTQETTGEPVTQEMVDAAKQAILDSVQDKLDEIKAKLADGASFEDLIVEYGTDPGMEDEERRVSGYPVHAGSTSYESNFAKAAMALQNVGDISEPVVSQFGVHLLHYAKDLPGGAAEYTDEIKEALREELLDQKTSEAYNKVLEQWINAAAVVYTEAGESWKLPEETATETAE